MRNISFVLTSLTIIFLWIFSFSPEIIAAGYQPSQGLVPCGNTPDNPCQITHFFEMLGRIYDFLVKWIASPLAVIALTIGGIMMMVSAGNPQIFAMGKQVVILAVIGLALVWGSWVIINFILTTLGYQGTWYSF